jgi:glucose-6-phosphate 1-epimerase
VTLCLEPDAAIRRVWPRNFVLRLTVHLGERLTLSLSGENHSDTEWHVSEALHAYFAVADAAVTRVTGLAGTTCVDKLAGNARDVQGQALAVVPPMDRVYLGHDGPVVVEDAAGGRRIVVDRTGGLSTIVWNPGAEGARALADMPDGAYTSMVCVEAGNALDDGYRLAPGQQHELRMSIAVE